MNSLKRRGDDCEDGKSSDIAELLESLTALRAEDAPEAAPTTPFANYEYGQLRHSLLSSTVSVISENTRPAPEESTQ